MQKRANSRRRRRREGEALSPLARNSTMSKQNKAADKAGFHNRPFTVQEIVFLTRALLGLTQLALLSIRRGLTVT